MSHQVATSEREVIFHRLVSDEKLILIRGEMIRDSNRSVNQFFVYLIGNIFLIACLDEHLPDELRTEKKKKFPFLLL